jgi:N-acyl-L-homoserine lactone synthetase
MVAIVNSVNRSLYEAELEEMFRFRHQVAIGEMGWDLPHAEADREVDQFDTEHAIYFLDYDRRGKLLASARLVPTDQPHLISEVFPDYCDLEDCPHDPNILEVSRFLVRRTGASKEEFAKARDRVMVATYEYANANGIGWLTALTYQKHYELAAFLTKTRPLGMAKYCEKDDDHYIAIRKQMTPNALAKIRQYARTPRQVSHYNVPLWAVGQIAEVSAQRRAA